MQLTTEDQAFIDRNLALAKPVTDLALLTHPHRTRLKRGGTALVLAAALAAGGASACTPTMVNCHPGTVHCWN